MYGNYWKQKVTIDDAGHEAFGNHSEFRATIKQNDGESPPGLPFKAEKRQNGSYPPRLS
jgi:hypothetical protein